MLGWRVVPACANFLLAELPGVGGTAHRFVERCRSRGLYLRAATGMGRSVGERMVRFAVKDAVTTRRMADIVRWVRDGQGQCGLLP